MCSILLAGSVTGCTAYHVGGSIQKGRAALLTGEPKVALAHFQRAAELDPGYKLRFTPLPQGVWTYVGRAHYAQGELAEAREALRQARSRHEEDDLAKLYLGLALARAGDYRRGLREIQAGLAGLANWLNDIERRHPHRAFWDPGRRIRGEIGKDLAMISGKDIDWETLIASGEWIGKKMEEEIDFVRREKSEELYRDDGDGTMN